MLTDAQCRNATCPPGKARLRLADSGGLHFEVSPAGSRRWFWKYRKAGKEARMALGSHLAVSLKAARLARDAAKLRKAGGVDPVHRVSVPVTGWAVLYDPPALTPSARIAIAPGSSRGFFLELAPKARVKRCCCSSASPASCVPQPHPQSELYFSAKRAGVAYGAMAAGQPDAGDGARPTAGGASAVKRVSRGLGCL